MDVDEAIKALAELQIDSISVFRVHVPIQLGIAGGLRRGRRQVLRAGLKIRSTGVVTLKKSEAT
jgi:hypothetical protein